MIITQKADFRLTLDRNGIEIAQMFPDGSKRSSHWIKLFDEDLEKLRDEISAIISQGTPA